MRTLTVLTVLTLILTLTLNTAQAANNPDPKLAGETFEELGSANFVITLLPDYTFVTRGMPSDPILVCSVVGLWINCPVPATSLHNTDPSLMVACPAFGGDDTDEAYNQWLSQCFFWNR